MQRPFIHFWHLQLDRRSPSARPLGSQSALRPQQPLWKNPMHLTRIDWLHLCVPFGLCRWRRRAGQLPAAVFETNMMSCPCSAITGCRWEGAEPLGSLNTKQECIKPGIKYPLNIKVFPSSRLTFKKCPLPPSQIKSDSESEQLVWISKWLLKKQLWYQTWGLISKEEEKKEQGPD